MKTAFITLLIMAATAFTPPSAEKSDSVELELMTWPELHRAIHQQGKVIALVYNGGTEQRGPHGITGAHTLMGRETVKAIALKLGNAIAAPVLPFSPNVPSVALPGTIGLSSAAFEMVNREVAEQLIRNGFTVVILMGDHFDGQKELAKVAVQLDHKFAPRGVHVFYCDEVYGKANDEFAVWLKANGYPPSGHGGLADTSELLYLGGDRGWVRKELLASGVGDPIQSPGHFHDSAYKRINNGIMGDARQATEKLGKRIFDMKVAYAVAQIKRMIRSARTARQNS